MSDVKESKVRFSCWDESSPRLLFDPYDDLGSLLFDMRNAYIDGDFEDRYLTVVTVRDVNLDTVCPNFMGKFYDILDDAYYGLFPDGDDSDQPIYDDGFEEKLLKLVKDSVHFGYNWMSDETVGIYDCKEGVWTERKDDGKYGNGE